MTYYFDECLSKEIAKVLQLLEQDVTSWADEFGDQGVKDPQWIAVAKRKKWVVLTTDAKIRKTPGIRELYERSGLIAVFICEGYANQGILKEAAWFLTHWDHIMSVTSKSGPGTSFRVGVNGKLQTWEEYQREHERKRGRN